MVFVTAAETAVSLKKIIDLYGNGIHTEARYRITIQEKIRNAPDTSAV